VAIDAWIPRTSDVDLIPVVDRPTPTAAGPNGNGGLSLLTAPVKKLFDDLVREWRADSQFLSSVDRIVMHPAYLRVIGLGPVAIPLILHELRREPDLWFLALIALTGEDAAAGEETVDGATQRWIEWGVSKGYLD